MELKSADCIKVGRDNNCEVRVTDISVSRIHAIFCKDDDNGFVLVDNNSKFGTLV